MIQIPQQSVPPIDNGSNLFSRAWWLALAGIGDTLNALNITVGGTGGTTTGSSAGAPNQITIIDVSVSDYTDASQTVTVAVTIAAPVSGVQPGSVYVWDDEPDSSVVVQGAADGTTPADGTVGEAGPFNPRFIGQITWQGDATQVITFTVQGVTDPQYYRVYACAATSSFTPAPIKHLVTGESPSVQYLLAPRSSATGTEYAPNVIGAALDSTWPDGWTSNPNITIGDSGDQLWQERVSFAWPTDDPNWPNLAGINGVLEYNGARHYLGDLLSTRDPYWQYLAGLPVLAGSTVYTLYLVSFDQNGKSNSIVHGVTPSVTFTIKRQTGIAGLEQCGAATSVVWTLGSLLGADGTYQLDLKITGVDPVDTQFGGYKLYVDTGSGPKEIRPPCQGRNLPLEWIGQNPVGVVSWTFSLVSIDTNNRPNTIVVGVTPQYTTNVGSASGLLDISQAKAGTFSGTHFLAAGTFSIKPGAISTTELTTAAIKIGGTGAPQDKPIQFIIYDHAGTAFGWIGDDNAVSGKAGGWFKELYVGGTSPATAPIQANASGVVTLSGLNVALISSNTINMLASDNVTSVALLNSSGTGSTLKLSHVTAFVQDATISLQCTSTGPVVIIADGSSNTSRMSATQISFGGVQVLTSQQVGPGAPSFAVLSDAQSWCAILRTALRNHGMIS